MPGVFFRPPGQDVTTPGDYQASATNPDGLARPTPFAPGDDVNLQISSITEGYKRLQSIQVAYYKMVSAQSKTNIYGESLVKYYYEPVMIKCYLERGDETYVIEEYGPDNSQQVKFFFVHVMLEQIGVLPQVGDIILDRERYYEVHNVSENLIDFGNDNDYLMNANNFDEAPLFKRGQSIVFELDGHMSRVSKLNLLPYKLQ
jgi:hypothetical protein